MVESLCQMESSNTKAILSAVATVRVATLSAAAVICCATATAQQVRCREARHAPEPARMVADVGICGDASRLVRVDIAHVTGETPPETCSGDFLSGYEGFRWHVSRHYAIASDMDDDAVRDALVLLELAWPQYGRIFGWRPSGGSRMAVVLASRRDLLEECMRRDAIFTPIKGGLTQEGFACSYLYAGAPYQTRYILLHEATHLYQYCLSGDTRGVFGFLREGIADYLSSHIYDPLSQTLFVNVLDRAPIHNHLEAGLAEWRERGRPRFSALAADPAPSRGISVLLVAYLRHTPAMALKWRLLCERLVRDAPAGNAAASVLATIQAQYGPLEAHDAGFDEWASSLSPTFSLLERDFDQSGPGSFTAMPVGSAAARLRICDVPATPFNVGITRPAEPYASAGFSGDVISASVSNTWSGACVFSARAHGREATREVPSAYVPVATTPIEISVSKTDGGIAIGFADAQGNDICKPMEFEARDADERQSIEISAQGGVAHFQLPSLAGAALGKWQKPPFLQEMVVAALRDTSQARWISSWRVAGPFKNADECRRVADGGFRDVAAHCPSRVSPPIVNLCEVFTGAATEAYAVVEATVDMDEDGVCDLVLGVADGVEVYVNGKRAGEAFKGKREWRHGNLRVAGVRLLKGPNTITLRLSHADSAWLLSAHLEAAGAADNR